jgi:hypothetical protein
MPFLKRRSPTKSIAMLLLLGSLSVTCWAQSHAPGTGRPAPAAGLPNGVQPAVIIQLPPNSPNGGVRPTPRPPEVAPVSPGQDTYSSTGAVPASQNATTYSSSGRVHNATDCVKGGVVRKCN